IGEGGIILGGGDRKTLSHGKNFAINNNLYDCSRWVRTYRAGIFMYGVGNIAVHNLIHDLPHTAIFFWGNDHLLEYNEIHHVCMETGDAGAFYIGRDWSQRGSIIRYNYFHHLHGVEGHGGFTDVMAIYLDDWASGNTIFGNIFYKAGRSIMIGGGRDNLVENNIVIDGNPAMHVDARGLGWAKYYFDGTNNTLFERLQAVNPTESPYKDKYPQLVHLLDDDPVLPKGNRFVRNISSGGRWIDLMNGVNDTLVYFQDNQINLDSSFYSFDEDDFYLKFDARMYPAGFRPIPLGRIGLKDQVNKE
ncbi:MAG: right-handed parallel beta-helix repeat-containing protein, partial [Bacteroidales bacterium]|nr:right-handed parallel beta-helix repeat-containing protein [Bacteroidales bacterium]